MAKSKVKVSAAAAIRQLDAAFMSGAASKDAKTIVQTVYTSDAVLMPPNGPSVKGRSNIQQFLQGMLDTGAVNVTVKTAQVDADGDLACGRGVYSMRVPGPDGTRQDDTGKYIIVCRRQRDGSWRVVADIWNSDRPTS